MENESITIELESWVIDTNTSLKDSRKFIVQSTRGEVAKFLDDVQQQIDAKFEQ